MIKNSFLVMYCAFIYATHSAPIHVKIKYTGDIDKEIVVNNINITFKNESARAQKRREPQDISPGILQRGGVGYIQYHNQMTLPAIIEYIDNQRSILQTRTTRRRGNNVLHRFEDNDDTKDRLNRFVMGRSKTYTLTPSFNFPFMRSPPKVPFAPERNRALYASERNRGLYGPKSTRVLNAPEIYRALDPPESNRVLDSPENSKALDAPESNRDVGYHDNHNPHSVDMNHIAETPEAVPHKHESSEISQMYRLLKKQQRMLESMETQMEKQIARGKASKEFYDLLEAATGHHTEGNTATSCNPDKKFQVLVDETAVRSALKNDPFVKRVLKMANRKRESYMQDIG